MNNRHAKHLKLTLLPSLKPRNPLVAAAAKRRAGSHTKPAKAERRAAKMVLKSKLDV